VDDDELLRRLARVLDTAPAAPPADRITALRAEVDSRRPLPGSSSRQRRGAWLGPSLAAAAAIVALLAGVAVGHRSGRRDAIAGTVEYDGPMVGGDAEPAAAELRVVATGTGRVVDLDTDSVPTLPRGEFYELWFVAPDDTTDAPDRISAGTFHPDAEGRSDVRLAAAVDPTRFPVVEVTAEPDADDPARNGPIVLRARLPAPA
jgi:hypothetical protein